MKLAILLSTYNSEVFIKSQLDSLLSQTYKDWTLFIRDDQSKDTTPQLLQHYSDNDSRIHILPDRNKRGARDGFMWLLQEVNADLYMFCDHDDVWLPEKIEKTVQLIEEQHCDNVPMIACTNLKLVDKELHVLADDYWTHRHYRNSDFNDKYFHLYYNNMPGCTMLINRKAREVALPYPKNTIMHDAWIASAVLWKGGKVVWTDEPLMLYRQHGDNTIGASDRTFMQQLGMLNELLAKTRTQYYSCLSLINMSYTRFFITKVYYLLRSYLSR